jgi:D-3-phosphoglycerate dehydrogenase
MKQIQLLNNIAQSGVAIFPQEQYTIATDVSDPDAVLVRSAKMHDMAFGPSLQVVGRAGTGVNNIPIERLTQMGVPVLNAPGANANAVKELVLSAMLITSRNVCKAWAHVSEFLVTAGADLNKQIEAMKKQFVGIELTGKTLGVIGLGNIGVLVANMAKSLGMNVIGFDPQLTVKQAWKLSSSIEEAANIEQLVANADFVSLHVPLNQHTQHLVNADLLHHMHENSVLLNFSRGEIVDNQAVLTALDNGQLGSYVCDFPDLLFKANSRVIMLPHLGASTAESETRCAVMVAKNVRDYLELGHISHSVNFPSIQMPKYPDTYRLAIVNQNIPNMVAQISSLLANEGMNVADLINRSKNDIAYTLVDVDQPINGAVQQAIEAIDGVVRVRVL